MQEKKEGKAVTAKMSLGKVHDLIELLVSTGMKEIRLSESK